MLLIGEIGPFDGFDFDAYIIKVFPDGGYIDKRFDMADTVSTFITIEVLENGNYFISGIYSKGGNYYERDHLWIVVLNPGLELISSESYKVRDAYIGFASASTSLIDNDGNIVVATSALNEEEDTEKTNFSDFAFYKFTSQGDTILSKYYSYIWDEWSWELKQMPNSNNMMLIERCTHYNNHNELMFLSPDLDILQVNNWANENSMSSDVSSDFWLTDTSFLVSGYGSIDTTPGSIVFTRVYHMDTSANVHSELILDRPDTLDYPAW